MPGVIVIMDMGAAVHFIGGGMAMLALLGAVPVRVHMGMGMVVAVRMRVGVRVVQITVPVPVLVRMGVIVRMLVQVIVRVTGGAGGLLVRHGGTLEVGRQGR